MGKKIKVVDIVTAEEPKEEPKEEPTLESNEVIADVEPEQVLVDDTPHTDNDEKQDVNTSMDDHRNDEPTPKPKAKRTGQSKKKQTVETIELPTLEEVPAMEVEEEIPAASIEGNVKVKKVVEQVKCPKCDKMMSEKSLRYTHEENCKGKIVKTEDLPVKRRNVKPTKEPTTTTQKEVKVETNKKEIYNKIVGKNVSLHSSEVEIPEELKLEVLKTIQRQQARIRMKEDNLNKLKMQIF